MTDAELYALVYKELCKAVDDLREKGYKVGYPENLVIVSNGTLTEADKPCTK